MHPVRRRRLIIVLGILAIITIIIALVVYALRQNFNHFYAPHQVQNNEAPLNKTIRIGGMVKEGSIQRSQEGLDISFIVRDNSSHEITVNYRGSLPDLFQENQGTIATGKLTSNTQFEAVQLLAKHDETYLPPEVKAAMEKGGHPAGQ